MLHAGAHRELDAITNRAVQRFQSRVHISMVLILVPGLMTLALRSLGIVASKGGLAAMSVRTMIQRLRRSLGGV